MVRKSPSPKSLRDAVRSRIPALRGSCFAAGTPVLTMFGTQGDRRDEHRRHRRSRRDVDTGQLDYRPVVMPTRRPAAEIVRITLADGEVLETTGGHAFWISGEGWALAKELQSGMLLHTLRGATPISQIEKADIQPTYNLVVDEFHTYFVGSDHILCHDMEFFEATNATLPGFYDMSETERRTEKRQMTEKPDDRKIAPDRVTHR